jgi:thioredoxin:protein disulfide reductase
MKMIRVLLPLLALVALAFAAQAQAGWVDRLSHFGSGQPSYLEPDKAFGLEVTAQDAHTLIARFRVTPKYYLYRDKVQFTLVAPNVSIAQIDLPRGEIKHDRNLGDLEVFHQSFQAAIRLTRTGTAAEKVVLQASYQGCSEEGLCYSPIDKTLTLALPAATGPNPPAGEAVLPAAGAAGAQVALSGAEAQSAPQNDNSRIASLFRQGNFWLIISFFFGAGLLLAFTPCVFPMVPILSGIIVGRGHKITHMHGFVLSLAYVLGMAITYAVAGVAAGFSGTMLSSALQTPWVLGAFAAVFVALALSMFGFYELQLPSALQSRLADASNKLHGGHLTGVFVMGALSAIIVGPCVAAPLAGALLYIGQTHDAFLGGSALFFMALGMGVPLLLIGASAGTLLPKAGAWMESVKRLFGVLLLAVAIWIISPLIPVGVEMLLWAILLILSAVFLHALDALPHNASPWHKLWKGCGILALLLGIAYLVGALSGAQDVLRPLSVIGSARADASVGPQFSRVKSLAELDARIAQAAGRPVVLDFYADWCVSCKEMERNTFTDGQVRAKLDSALLLQADVTADSADDKALLARYHLYGPPAMLFFDSHGREQGDARVTGYQDSAQFLQSLQRAGL